MIGDVLQNQLVNLDARKEKDRRKFLKVVGQAHTKAANEYDKLMGAWNFW